MKATAVTFEHPGALALRTLSLPDPGAADVVVDVEWTGISTGTERLLFTGRMPAFPGLGYPLVPGYETVGRIVDAGSDSQARVGDQVFVPGSRSFPDVHCLFGGTARRLVVPAARAHRIDKSLGADAALLALAATAYHALRTSRGSHPDLIVGHGAFGRLLARLAVVLDPAQAPTVWEVNPARADGARGYRVLHPDDDGARRFHSIYDASGDAAMIDPLVSRLAQDGELVLAGFYAAETIAFRFTPAFLRGARLRVAKEWEPSDLAAVIMLANAGTLRLDDIVSHRFPASDAAQAYPAAFDDPSCIKMLLDWREVAA